MTEEIKQPLCFVIMPFGEIGSEKYNKYKSVYEEIIKRPLEQVGFTCIRGDEIPDFGPIPESIKTKLSIADLVIADLSERNPNVYYELGFRHACNKPTLSISNDLKGLPFDISTYRTVLYRYDDFSITNECRNKIKDFASEILNDLKTRGYFIDEQKKTALPKKKVSLADINKNLTVKLSNIYQILGEIIPKVNKENDIECQIDLLYKSVEKLDTNVENAMNKIGKHEGSVSTDKRFSILKGVFENGVEEIFKRRDDAYKKIIEILPIAEKRVDIMGISLRRFFHKQIDYNDDVKRILENHKAEWRIMVIDPMSEQALFRSLREEESTYNNMIKDPFSNYSLVSYEELINKYLNTYTKMNLYRDVHRTNDDIDSLFNQRNLRIKLRYYRASPVCFLAIIDESMFIELYHYGATSNERLAEQVPVFEFNSSSSMYKQMSGHFEYIWNKLSKDSFISEKKPEEK